MVFSSGDSGIQGKGGPPAGPLSSSCDWGRGKKRPLIRHGIRRDTFPLRGGFRAAGSRPLRGDIFSFLRPLISHLLPLFCQSRRDTTAGCMPIDTPAAAAQTGNCVSPTAPDAGAMSKARVSIGGPGKADCGPQAERTWSRGPAQRIPRRLFVPFWTLRKEPACRAEPSLAGPMTGTETGVGRPLIRHGIRRDTFPLRGKAFRGGTKQ